MWDLFRPKGSVTGFFVSLPCTPYQYNSTKLHTILYAYYHRKFNFVIHNIVKIELKLKISIRCDEWAICLFWQIEL